MRAMRRGTMLGIILCTIVGVVQAHAAPARKAGAATPISTIQAFVSAAAGVQVTISCDASLPAGLDGWTTFDYVVHVSQAECWAAEQATTWRSPDPAVWSDTAEGARADLVSGPALEVLLHEAMHNALQSHDEGVVECEAWRNRWALVGAFGLPAWRASMLAAGMTWRHEQSAPQYRTVC